MLTLTIIHIIVGEVQITGPVTTRLVRCAECDIRCKNLVRERNRWAFSPTVPSGGGGGGSSSRSASSARKSGSSFEFFTSSPDAIAEEVVRVATSSQSVATEDALIKIAKIAALDPLIFNAINPVELPGGEVVIFCPTVLEPEQTCTCSVYSIKQKRTNNMFYCNQCWSRARQREYRDAVALEGTEGGSAADVVSKPPRSEFTRFTVLSREELVAQCVKKTAMCRALRKRYARVSARNQRLVAGANISLSECSSAVDAEVVTSVSSVCERMRDKPGDAKAALETALRRRYVVR